METQQGKDPNKRSKNLKNIGFIGLLLIFGLIAMAFLVRPPELKEVALSDVVKRANNGEIDDLLLAERQLT